MPEAKIQIATPEQVRELLERACERFEQSNEGPFGSMTNGEFEYLNAAFQFCADTAVDSKDTSVISWLVRALHLLELYADKKPCEHIAYCIQQLLSFGAALSSSIKELSHHKKSYVRYSIARGLIPRGDPEIKLLERLSRDPDIDVRKAARENLQQVKTIPWWDGIFSADPAVGLSPEEEARLAPIFERLPALLGERRCTGKDIVPLARELPDRILFDLGGLLLAGHEAVKSKELLPLLSELLERAESAPTIRKIFEVWRGWPTKEYGTNRLYDILDKAPSETLAPLCCELISSVHEAIKEAPSGLKDERALNAVHLIARYWAAGPAPLELFELALSIPRETYEGRRLSQGLFALFTRQEIDPLPVLPRALALRLQIKEQFSELASALTPLLKRAPTEMIRPAAQQAISSDEQPIVVWGLEQFVERGHDPEKDPPLHEFLSAWLQTPRYRAAVASSSLLTMRAFPMLRQMLRDRSLRLSEILPVMRAMLEIYGRSPNPERAPKEPEGVNIPEALRGPPTEEEWSTLRVARAQQPPTEYTEWIQVFNLLPRGPWHSEDRAFFEEALARCRRGEEMLAYPLMTAIVTKSLEEDLPLVNELSSLANEDSMDVIGYLRERLFKNLGIEETSEEEEEIQPVTEWMDEEEEEET